MLGGVVGGQGPGRGATVVDWLAGPAQLDCGGRAHLGWGWLGVGAAGSWPASSTPYWNGWDNQEWGWPGGGGCGPIRSGAGGKG